MELFLLICKNLLEYWDSVMSVIFFLRGEENFSATPCRNFFHATRQDGCKRNLDASPIGIDRVNLPLCLYFAFLHFCENKCACL